MDLDSEFYKTIADKEPSGGSATFHARIPEKIAFDFKRMPKSEIPLESLQRTPHSKQKKFDKYLQKMRSPGTGRRSFSVEGKNLDH